ncbi:MAG: hypothetical protein ACRELB_10880, partial [Polyangiaceae bacterium]
MRPLESSAHPREAASLALHAVASDAWLRRSIVEADVPAGLPALRGEALDEAWPLAVALRRALRARGRWARILL